MQYFGDRLKRLRIEHNLTQEQLAQRVGVLKASISSYELGKQYPTINTLIKLCNLFDVSADYLIGRSDSMQLMQRDLTDEQIAAIQQIISEYEKLNKLLYR